ncbi:sorting nexin-13 isoform X2 [Aplysia californica]|uniref:Sorting nexin-13 isoform X2 n=1 Tax=Aplysia californica TaxID=6500 RepID=A0ABM0JAV8_APLCA|nr:sorting nexin-13 isoform X2 [Aplysia californica]
MEVVGNGWLWVILGSCLFFITFGGLAVFLSLYFVAFCAGCLVIVFHFGKQAMANEEKHDDVSGRCHVSKGLEKIKESMEPTTKIKNFDKRMTGASVIDDVLKEVLEYTVRDYIKTWYRQISDHDNFLVDIWQCAQKVVISFSNRSKEIDWMPYFTQRLVDDFASHIRLYRRAADKTAKSKNEDNGAALESAFFDMEVEMENSMCRDLVCLDPKAERQYLQDLSEVLLYLLLPTEDFHNKPFRYIVREVLVNGIFLPTIDLLSDPDYINQYIAWLCYETSFTPETFLTVIRSSDHMEELLAVRDKVDSDIARWRSKDTGGSDDTTVKQNLNSLMFLRDTCDLRIRRLQDGPVTEQIIDEPDFLKYQSLYVLSLDDIFNNNIALQSFIEYLKSRGGEQYLFFYLNVEGFRAAAEQQISEMQKQTQDSETAVEPDLESLRKLAVIIYDQYLSDKASVKLKIEPHIIKYTVQRLKSKMMSEDVFDSVQARVYQILHCQFYEDFLQCPAYVRLLGELGLLGGQSEDGDTFSLDDDGSAQTGSECSVGSAEDLVDVQNEESISDTISVGSASSATSAGSPAGDVYLYAQITQSGIVKEPDKSGKSYAVFAVTVRKKEPYAEEEEMWDVYRRYSDFHDLHMILTEKFPELTIPQLPGKTVLKKTNQSFLEKRRKDLDKYLRSLMKPELLQNVAGLEDLLNQFLHTGIWEKHKSEFSRKMDTIVNPLKTASKNVGNAVKSVPDGVSKIGDGLGKVFASQRSMEQTKARELLNQGKVGAGLDPELVENIPLRIMLLLMDEVFDLRHKNQWLRRRIVAILRQLIKATFGDKINRKIVEHVDFMTSSEQMAEYVAAFRNSFWPNGVLAEARPPREEATKMRTRVLCKAKMLGSVPDEVRTLMGTDAVRKGVARIFQMFQHKNLNKRVLYVVLEGVLATLFPENKFPALFRNLHSRSTRAEKVREQQQAAAAQESQLRKRAGKR